MLGTRLFRVGELSHRLPADSDQDDSITLQMAEEITTPKLIRGLTERLSVSSEYCRVIHEYKVAEQSFRDEDAQTSPSLALALGFTGVAQLAEVGGYAR